MLQIVLLDIYRSTRGRAMISKGERGEGVDMKKKETGPGEVQNFTM